MKNGRLGDFLLNLIINPRATVTSENMNNYDYSALNRIYYLLGVIGSTVNIFKGLYLREEKIDLMTIFSVFFSAILIWVWLFIFKKVLIFIYYIVFKSIKDENISFAWVDRLFSPLILITSVPISVLFVGFRNVLIRNINLFSMISYVFSIIQIGYCVTLAYYIVKNIFMQNKFKSFYLGSLPIIVINCVWFYIQLALKKVIA